MLGPGSSAAAPTARSTAAHTPALGMVAAMAALLELDMVAMAAAHMAVELMAAIMGGMAAHMVILCMVGQQGVMVGCMGNPMEGLAALMVALTAVASAL